MPMLHTTANTTPLQMRAPGPSSYTVLAGIGAELGAIPGRLERTLGGGVPQIKEQTFPPTFVSGLDAELILENWINGVGKVRTRSAAKALVLENMLDVFREQLSLKKALMIERRRNFTNLQRDTIDIVRNKAPGRKALPEREPSMDVSSWGKQVEVVALIPEDLETFYLGPYRGLHTTSFYAHAFGIFSRDQFPDDSQGSLKQVLPARPWWIPANRPLDVFLIEGLADAPGLSMQMTRVLLSRIAKYASKEQRAVVVSKRALTSDVDGADLTDYYVRLGFEKVVMEGGSYTLVLPDGAFESAGDKWWLGSKEDQKEIMVSLTSLLTCRRCT